MVSSDCRLIFFAPCNDVICKRHHECYSGYQSDVVRCGNIDNSEKNRNDTHDIARPSERVRGPCEVVAEYPDNAIPIVNCTQVKSDIVQGQY